MNEAISIFGDPIPQIPIPGQSIGGFGISTGTTTMTQAPPMPKPNANGLIGVKGCLVIEGEMTGDGRMVLNDAVYWEESPWSLMGQVVNDGHQGAPLVGRMDNLARMGNRIMFEGVIDCNIEAGAENARLIHNKLLRGISLDPDDAEMQHHLPDGRILEEMTPDELEQLTGEEWDSVILVATRLRVRGGTMLPMPAFVDTELELFELDDLVAGGALAASNKDNLPPTNWFQNPDLKEATPLTITKDGRIFGHVALWGQCHIGMPGGCVTPPRSSSDYAYFTRGSVATWCAECGREEEVAIGPITAGTGHASTNMSKGAAVAHYDNSGYRVADVAAGEDAYGIWISGRLAPTAKQEQIESLLSIGVSGDWRRIGGALDLVAILSVPVPGYPIARKVLAHVASGYAQTSLITPFFGGRGKMESLERTVESLKKVSIKLMSDKVNAG